MQGVFAADGIDVQVVLLQLGDNFAGFVYPDVTSGAVMVHAA